MYVHTDTQNEGCSERQGREEPQGDGDKIK